MAITLPAFTREPLSRLLQLDDSQKEDFLKAIAAAETTANPHTYAQRLSREFPLLGVDEMVEVVATMVTLYNFAMVDRDIEVVARDVVAAFRNSGGPIVRDASEDKLEALEGFIASVWSADKFAISAKAVRLSSAYEKLYGSSEILSDIRPIFPADSLEKTPTEAIVMHSLRLRSYEEGETREQFYVMNYKDLIQLQKTLERAIKKHGILSEMVEKFEMHYVSDSEEQA